MQTKELINYLIKLLNINTNDPFILNEIIEDLESVHDKELLRHFIKQKFNYSKYEYLNGLQKFTALLNDFKKEFQPTLTDEQQKAVGNYADELYRRTVNLFDELQWLVNSGYSLDEDVCKVEIYKAYNNRQKDLKVLKALGGKNEIYRLNITSKEKLRSKIFEEVNRLTIKKTYPQLQNKSKEMLLLEKLEK